MDEASAVRSICGKDMSVRRRMFRRVYEVTDEGFLEYHLGPALERVSEKAGELFEEYVAPHVPKALAAGAGGAVLAFAPSALAEDVDAPAARERPAYRIGLEHEDTGQWEKVDPFTGFKLWYPRSWTTSLAAYRDDERLAVASHYEGGGGAGTANIFGGRVPAHDLTGMGECEAEVLAHGFLAEERDSWGGKNTTWSAGGEASGKLVVPGLKDYLEAVSLHAAGEAFRSKMERPRSPTYRYENDILMLVGGIRLPTGTELHGGLDYNRNRQKMSGQDWMFRTQGRGAHLMAMQDLDLDLPVFGDAFLAFGVDYFYKRKGVQDSKRASWCVGTYGGEGTHLDFRHTGSTIFDGRCDFDFVLALNGSMGRKDHARRIGFRDGGRNDSLFAANPMDFYQVGLRDLKELPDYTRTAALELETEWVNYPHMDARNFGSFNGVVYPVGMATMFTGGDEIPVVSWIWAGGGYDTRDRRWSGSVGINMRPSGDIPFLFRLEAGKREGSHPTVHVSGLWEF